MLATLPQDIAMSQYARAKAFKINELVRTIHEASFEWYGFTLAAGDNPELIIDIGLPSNSYNLLDYTVLAAAGIAEFQEALSRGYDYQRLDTFSRCPGLQAFLAHRRKKSPQGFRFYRCAPKTAGGQKRSCHTRPCFAGERPVCQKRIWQEAVFPL